tara:strand:+ start:8060 stop:8266 length:207 start_codon:yes stop_codon:yes gene_type:complete
MNDETRSILLDLIDYYNTMGTEKDPGICVFEDIVKRASKLLSRNQSTGTVRIDPFDMCNAPIKSEEEW